MKEGKKKTVEYLTAAPNKEMLSILEHSERGVIIMDTEFVVKWFNSVAARGIQIVTKNRLKTGKSYWDYTVKDSGKTFYRNFNQALKGKSVSVEKHLGFPDGREVWVDGRFSPLWTGNGEVGGVVYSYKNITAQKHQEKRDQELTRTLRAITENENHAFLIADPKYKIKTFNKAWEELIPGSHDLKVEDNLFDHLPDDWKEEVLGGLLIARTGGKVSLDLHDPMFKENVSEFHLSKVKMFDSDDFVYVIWGDDISDKVKTKLALKRSEDNLKAMVNNSNQGFFLLNEELKIEAFNQAGELLIQQLYHSKLEVGSDITKILIGENVRQFREEAARAFQGKTIKVEKYLRANGREYWLERHYNPVRSIRGKSYDRITIWTMDITDRKLAEKALRESEKRFRQLAALTPVGIYQTDKNGNTVYMNDSLLRVLNVELSEALTGEWMHKIHEEDRDLASQQWNRAEGNITDYSFEYRIKRGDGNITYVIETAQPMYNNLDEYIGYIGTVVDVTQQKVNQQLGQQKAVAERSLKFRSDFLASMSHEMRTPLNGIMGMSEALLSSELSEEQKHQVHNVFSSAQDLRSIVNEVLDLAKIEAGKTEIKKDHVELSDLLDTVITRHMPEAQKKDLFLKTDVGLQNFEFGSDRRRLIQILSNLVRNGLKFTDKGGVSVKAYKVDESLVRFEVKDTGPGIKESELGKLFKDFSQLDHTTAQDLEGTGLGLSICKKLVELLGGDCGVDSQVGKGSTFWFTVKMGQLTKDMKKALPLEVEPISEVPSKLNVLLVEDNLINQQAFKMMLQKMGCQVTMANDGEQAINIYRKADFDIIFMDIQMPIMDGITATRTIKSESQQTPPIIGLSGNIVDRDENGKLTSDMDDMLLKPVVSDELKKMISKWVAA